MKLSVLLFSAGLALATSAATADCPPVLQIAAFEGQVSIKPAGKVVKKSPGALPSPLCAGDEVHTFRGKALIRSPGKDAITLDADSVLTVASADKAQLDKGQALFDIQKRQVGQGLQVATRLSVIGVKGTRFLVADRPEGVSCALDEGVVDVSSTKGKLGLYREKVVEARERSFDDFKREIQEGVAAEKKAFADYKVKVQKEFVAYVESVTMKAGTELTISDGEAVERDSGEKVKAELERLRQWQRQF